MTGIDRIVREQTDCLKELTASATQQIDSARLRESVRRAGQKAARVELRGWSRLVRYLLGG